METELDDGGQNMWKKKRRPKHWRMWAGKLTAAPKGQEMRGCVCVWGGGRHNSLWMKLHLHLQPHTLLCR